MLTTYADVCWHSQPQARALGQDAADAGVDACGQGKQFSCIYWYKSTNTDAAEEQECEEATYADVC